MTTASTSTKTWTKPVLTQLGTIKDVAGPIGSGLEGGPNAKS